MRRPEESVGKRACAEEERQDEERVALSSRDLRAVVWIVIVEANLTRHD
jgi:hypothetical protein